jgi:hypothetical protein
MAPIRLAIETLRKRATQMIPIEVVHTDLPSRRGVPTPVGVIRDCFCWRDRGHCSMHFYNPQLGNVVELQSNLTVVQVSIMDRNELSFEKIKELAEKASCQHCDVSTSVMPPAGYPIFATRRRGFLNPRPVELLVVVAFPG